MKSTHQKRIDFENYYNSKVRGFFTDGEYPGYGLTFLNDNEMAIKISTLKNIPEEVLDEIKVRYTEVFIEGKD